MQKALSRNPSPGEERPVTRNNRVAVQVYHANAAPPEPGLVCVYSSTADDGELHVTLGPDPRQQQQ
jgi:hypothetical protein